MLDAFYLTISSISINVGSECDLTCSRSYTITVPVVK